ncbi:MAG: hypothetical protein ABII71_01705 [Candidatus Micrarchaeota archaeon]
MPGCAGPAQLGSGDSSIAIQEEQSVSHEGAWGIYSLDLSSGQTRLVFSSDDPIAHLSMDPTGNRLAFSQRIGADADDNEEICVIGIDGSSYNRLTDNDVLDTYPSWSPDGSRLAFLRWVNSSLDIFVMDSDGRNPRLLYGSDYHDADVDWGIGAIAFTRESQVWVMGEDGGGERRLTSPPRAGEWGKANLPFGDYDPRISPDGSKVVFERLLGDDSPHGNYDIFIINTDGSGEHALTDSGYSQGLPEWSNDGSKIAYIVAAMGNAGKYRIYAIDSLGRNIADITPGYFPAGFLCHSVVFSNDDSEVYFIGQWWE